MKTSGSVAESALRALVREAVGEGSPDALSQLEALGREAEAMRNKISEVSALLPKSVMLSWRTAVDGFDEFKFQIAVCRAKLKKAGG